MYIIETLVHDGYLPIADWYLSVLHLVYDVSVEQIYSPVARTFFMQRCRVKNKSIYKRPVMYHVTFETSDKYVLESQTRAYIMLMTTVTQTDFAYALRLCLCLRACGLFHVKPSLICVPWINKIIEFRKNVIQHWLFQSYMDVKHWYLQKINKKKINSAFKKFF